jgi:hypothetical protein
MEPAVLARDRLIAGLEIDDAETGMAETDVAVGSDPLLLAVRTPPHQLLGGPLDVPGGDGAAW